MIIFGKGTDMASKKIGDMKAVPAALFLIGIVMLVEAAATIFVISHAPAMMSSAASWAYALVKGIVSLYVLFASWKMTKGRLK